MTTAKPTTTKATSRFRLPDPPERQDDEKMSTVDHLHQPGNTHHLLQHLGNPETTLVTAERFITMMPERRLPSGRTRRVPDLLIAFDADPQLYQADNGYIVQAQGKPPDFVLEVASRSTGSEDTGPKRDDYAALGILEYWRFDPTGEFHGTKLAGDRLVDGAYQPIPIDQLDDDTLQGYSAALSLILRWDQGQLGWYDPETEQHIATFDSERARADNAEAELRAAEARIHELEQRLQQQDY
jgi:Uma2 family endonuclease